MSRGARLLIVLTVGTIAIGSLLLGWIRDGVSGESMVLAIGGLALFSVASILVMKVPENRLSWLLLMMSFGFGLMAVLNGSPDGSIGEIVGGLALFGLVLPGLGVFVPLWFPIGTPPTPRWRWVGWCAEVGIVAIVAGWFLVIYWEGGDNDIESCVSVGTCSSILGVILLLVAIVAGIAALIVRWVRSSGVERLQMKWLVLAFLVFGIGAFAEFGGFQYSLVANVFLPAGVALIPITIGIALLRYRLYEIDRILARTVSYTVVVVALGAVYVGGVTWLTTLLPDQSELVVAATTLAVAALFNPLRKRVQGWVDRRFNRSRYNTQRVMDDFAGSLRDHVDSDEVMTGWVDVVNETMQPAAVGVWIRSEDRT